MTQIAMNSKASNTTKIFSYFINFEKESNLFEQELQHISTNLIMNRVKKFKKIKDNIQKMQFKSSTYVNKRRKNSSQLKEKDKVYLLTKNLTTKKLNKKLNYTKIGSFFIKAIKKSVSYELNLFKNTRIHSIFHINLLESADSNTPIQKKFHFENSKKEYAMKEILKRKDQKYFVKWKKYSHTNNTWELFKNLTKCQKLLKKFYQKKKSRIIRQ